MKIVVSAAVYTQMFLCGLVYCAIALPWLILFCLCTGFRKRPCQAQIRFLILWFGHTMVRIATLPYVRVTTEDVSGEPPPGRAILIFNHRSASDPFLVSALRTRTPPAQAVNGWPMRLPFFGVFARLGGYLDVTRLPYEETLKRTQVLLEQDVPIAVFPEGTRSGSTEMNQFHGTFFRIARELGVPLIPVAIAGNERIPDRRFRLSPGHILIRRLAAIPADAVCGTALFPLKEMVHKRLRQETERMDERLNNE